MAGNDVPSVFETSVLFAMIVHAILALAANAMLSWLNLRLDRLDRLDRLARADAEYRRHQVLSKMATATTPRPGPISPPTPAPAPDRSIGQPPSVG